MVDILDKYDYSMMFSGCQSIYFATNFSDLDTQKNDFSEKEPEKQVKFDDFDWEADMKTAFGV